MRTWLMVGALASTVLGAGCAHEGTREEAELGRIPMSQKQDVFAAQHNVSVAEANISNAEQARDQAKSFKSIADDEYKAARSRLNAAEKTVAMARRTSGAPATETEVQVAQRQLAAAGSKRDYADRLLSLRGDEVNLARRQHDGAQANLRVARLATLQRAGMAVPENLGKVTRERDEIAMDVSRREHEVAAKREQVDATKVAWETARRSYDVAARENPVAPPVQPPREPEMLPPQGAPPQGQPKP